MQNEDIRKVYLANNALDEQLLEGKSWYVFPALTLNVYPHGAQLHRHRPDPTDPERAWLDQLTFTRLRPGQARPTPRVSHLDVDGVPGSGRVTEDDVREALAVQRGMRSPGFRELRLGDREVALAHMHAMLDRYLTA